MTGECDHDGKAEGRLLIRSGQLAGVVICAECGMLLAAQGMDEYAPSPLLGTDNPTSDV